MGINSWVKQQSDYYSTTEYDKNDLEHPDYRVFIKNVVKGRDERVMELGCNNGLVLEYLRETRDVEIMGIDLPEVAKKAEKEFIIPADLNKGLPSVKQIGRFDVIGMFGTIEHLYNDWTVLGSIKNYLTEEGRFIISIPTAMNISKYHLRYYPAVEFMRLMDVAGLQVVDMKRHPDYPNQQERIWVFKRKL